MNERVRSDETRFATWKFIRYARSQSTICDPLRRTRSFIRDCDGGSSGAVVAAGGGGGGGGFTAAKNTSTPRSPAGDDKLCCIVLWRVFNAHRYTA